MSVYSPKMTSPSVSAGQDHVLEPVDHDLDRIAGVVEDPERRVLDAGRRQPEPARDEEDDHETEPLRRHRVEAEASPERALVRRRAAPPGGDDTGRDAEARSRRGSRARPSGRVFLIGSHSTLVTGSSVRNERPRFPWREIAEVDLVLLPLRLVEAELAALVLLELLRALPAPQRRDGVAGDRPEEDEVQRDRDEDGADREQHPLDDVVGSAQSSEGAVRDPILAHAQPSLPAGSCSTSSSTRSAGS